LAKLYLITLDLPKLSHAEQGKIAIAEKVPFLQLRMKNANHLEISQTIEAILPELKRSETKLIVNDHISFIGKSGVAGVHLGQSDLSRRPFDELRVTKPKNNDKNNVMLSSACTELIEVSKHEKGKNILGITANTNADIESAIKYGASYIGLGPFQYTITKSNLEKTLGVQGIKIITDKYADRIPIFAIGGINLENIDHLADLKLAGVAISSAVFASENPRDAIQKFTQKLDAFAEAIHA
jgi:thiamine-phosphate pyrophosphorylase